jgi:quercetin dioxygenase-like cupin family protein
MSTERQQEQASLYVLGALPPDERMAFERDLGGDVELQQLVRSLRNSVGLVSAVIPRREPPANLKAKVLERIAESEVPGIREPESAPVTPGFRFLAAEAANWKALPVPGAWIQLLSVDLDRGYAVLLGRLDRGVRYPAHTHEGSEDLYLLTGDLRLGDRVMRAGDFHHSDPGTSHGENWTAEGCTLLAVVSTSHTLAKFAMAT